MDFIMLQLFHVFTYKICTSNNLKIYILYVLLKSILNNQTPVNNNYEFYVTLSVYYCLLFFYPVFYRKESNTLCRLNSGDQIESFLTSLVKVSSFAKKTFERNKIGELDMATSQHSCGLCTQVRIPAGNDIREIEILTDYYINLFNDVY